MALTDVENEAIIEELTRTLPPMDPAVAGAAILEAKHVLDGLGVAFYLRDGTCLGAIREGAIIPWDDDIDFGVTFGLHGFSEQMIDPIITAFRDAGFYVSPGYFDTHVYLCLLKNRHLLSLTFFRSKRGHVTIYPGLALPLRLFDRLKEIEFLGETFMVPNPPEEYLELKYGPDWRTPKHIGYEKDVVDSVGPGPAPGPWLRLGRMVNRTLFPGRLAQLQVLNHQGEPVPGAEVVAAGHGRYRSDARGYARLQVPIDYYYALAVRFEGHEEVLYLERLAPGGRYVYQPDSAAPAGRAYALYDVGAAQP